MINPGDVLEVSITDPPQGFTTVVRDLTTGQTGYMIASAGNGFMNTNIADLRRHPVHLPRRVQHRRAAEPGAVGRARGRRADGAGDRPLRGLQLGDATRTRSPPPSRTASPTVDPNVFDTCVGGSEGPTATGEGPCSPRRICQNATTQGPTGRSPARPLTAASGAAVRVRRRLLLPAGHADRCWSTATPTTESIAGQRVLQQQVPER